MRTLLLTGEGRYSDPWHPFAETSAAVAGLLSDRGHRVDIRGDVDDALSQLEDLPDLVVVNVGLPRDGAASPAPTARAGLARLLRSPVPLLGLHVSSTSFVDAVEWPQLLGGRWVHDVSMHPDFGPARIRITGAGHPVTAGAADFELEDERYSWLEVSPSAEVLAVHEHEGIDHPLIWALERPSGGRTVYDALGHTAASYDSPAHRALLAGALDWLGV